jgi:hypothetical protein
MKSTWSLITVLAALVLGIIPLTSHGADYTSDASINVRTDSRSISTQCAVEQLPLLTGCETAGENPVTIPAALKQTGEMDQKQATKQIDDTGTLLEELVKSEIAYGAVKSRYP